MILSSLHLSSTQLVNITDQYMALMADNGDIREDLRVPDSDVGKEIGAKFEQGDDFMVSVEEPLTIQIPCGHRMRLQDAVTDWCVFCVVSRSL